MAFPEYTRLPFSAYPQNTAQDVAGAGYAAYGSQLNAQNAYNANQQRLAAEAAWNAQQQAAAPNTYANRSELERELAYNENEIRYLQNQLETMRAEWMDQDSFDRKLAANRAAIGDFGNARAHQNDIIARQNDRNRVADTAMQWRWQAKQNEIARQADKEKQAKAEIKRLIGEIEDLDTARPYHTDQGAINALDAKRARLVRELAASVVSNKRTTTMFPSTTSHQSSRTRSHPTTSTRKDASSMLTRGRKSQILTTSWVSRQRQSV